MASIIYFICFWLGSAGELPQLPSVCRRRKTCLKTMSIRVIRRETCVLSPAFVVIGAKAVLHKNQEQMSPKLSATARSAIFPLNRLHYVLLQPPSVCLSSLYHVSRVTLTLSVMQVRLETHQPLEWHVNHTGDAGSDPAAADRWIGVAESRPSHHSDCQTEPLPIPLPIPRGLVYPRAGPDG